MNDTIKELHATLSREKLMNEKRLGSYHPVWMHQSHPTVLSTDGFEPMCKVLKTRLT